MSSFVKATREKTFAKVGIMGAAGSGKSFSMLILAHAMKAAGLGKKIAVIDAENGKIKKYAGYVVDEQRWEFDVCVLTSYSPQEYCARIQEAAQHGYDIIVIDGISQEWAGKNGALETVDQLGGKNKFTSGWSAVTPMHNNFLETMLAVPAHVLCTIRSKMGYTLQEEEKNGRTIQVPKRIGMEPIQRNGVEYEMEVIFDISTDHIIRVTKTICPDLDGATCVAPKSSFFAPLIKWLGTGDDVKVNFHYGFITAERANQIVQRLVAANVNLDTERDWLFTNYFVRGFDQLTEDQCKRYEGSRLEYLERAAKANDNGGMTLQEALEHESPPAPTPEPASPSPSPVNDKIPDGMPPGVAPDRLSACRDLFEEICYLMSVTNDAKPAFFKEAVLDRLKVASADQLTSEQLRELAWKFAAKINTLHAERGTPTASPFCSVPALQAT